MTKVLCGSGLRWLAPALVVMMVFSKSAIAQKPPQWPLWERYAHSTIDEQGRVIDRSAQDRTTSEGQAYAMFFALVADDRLRFEKVLGWTETNLASGDLGQRLPSWMWGKAPDGLWHVIDRNPAADADLWMAYDLSEAGRLWGVARYQKLGLAMAMRIAQQEVAYIPGLGTTLLAGATGFHPSSDTWIVNPSYLPPFLLAYFNKVMPNGPWGAVLKSLQPMLSEGSGARYAMDWVSAGRTIQPALSPAQTSSGDHGARPIGSYDAIRVYLWLGMADPFTPGVKALLPRVSGMSAYLREHPVPPEKVDDAGRIVSATGPPGFSAALIPYLHALALTAEEAVQAKRLAAALDSSSGLYGQNGAYYDQNLALFSTGWSEHRFRFDHEGNLTAGRQRAARPHVSH